MATVLPTEGGCHAPACKAHEWWRNPRVGRMVSRLSANLGGHRATMRLGRGRATAGLVVGGATIVILGLSVGAATVRSHSNAGADPVRAAATGPAPALHVSGEHGGQVAWDH